MMNKIRHEVKIAALVPFKRKKNKVTYSGQIYHRVEIGTKYDVMEITVDWPQKI